jgi:outer membrane protein TolC
VLLWVSLLWSPASAAEVQLELDDAVTRAWETWADARIQQARIASAEADVRLERDLDDPQLRARMENIGSNVDVPQYTFRIRQDVQPLGAVRGRVRAARAAVEAERADLAALQWAVRADTALVFDGVRVLEEAARLATAEEEATVRWIAVVRKRVDAQVGAPDDLLEAELAQLSALRRRLRVEQELAAARAELAELIGLAPTDTPVLTGPPLAELAAGPVGEAPDDPDVLRAEARVREEEAWRTAAIAEQRPFLDFVEVEAVLEPGEVAAYGVQLAASIPIFSLQNGAVRAANARIAQREAEVRGRSEEARRRRTRRAAELEASLDAHERFVEAIERVSEQLAAVEATLRPDRYWERTADLARERQEALELLHQALIARRRVESGG